MLGEGLRPAAGLGVGQQRLEQQGQVPRVGVDPGRRGRVEHIDRGHVAVAGDLLEEGPRLAAGADHELGTGVGLAQGDGAQARVSRPPAVCAAAVMRGVQAVGPLPGGGQVGVEERQHVRPGREVRGPQRLKRLAEVAHHGRPDVADRRLGGDRRARDRAEVRAEAEHRPAVVDRAVVGVVAVGEVAVADELGPDHDVLPGLVAEPGRVRGRPDDAAPRGELVLLGERLLVLQLDGPGPQRSAGVRHGGRRPGDRLGVVAAGPLAGDVEVQLHVVRAAVEAAGRHQDVAHRDRLPARVTGLDRGQELDDQADAAALQVEPGPGRRDLQQGLVQALLEALDRAGGAVVPVRDVEHDRRGAHEQVGDPVDAGDAAHGRDVPGPELLPGAGQRGRGQPGAQVGAADGERGGRGPDGGGGQAGRRGGLCRGERVGELRFRWAGRAAAFREGAPGRRPQAGPGSRARHAARGGGDSGVAQEGPPGGFPGPSVA